MQLLKTAIEYEKSDKFDRFYIMQQKQYLTPLINQMSLMHIVYDIIAENLFQKE